MGSCDSLLISVSVSNRSNIVLAAIYTSGLMAEEQDLGRVVPRILLIVPPLCSQESLGFALQPLNWFLIEVGGGLQAFI